MLTLIVEICRCQSRQYSFLLNLSERNNYILHPLEVNHSKIVNLSKIVKQFKDKLYDIIE